MENKDRLIKKYGTNWNAFNGSMTDIELLIGCGVLSLDSKAGFPVTKRIFALTYLGQEVFFVEESDLSAYYATRR